MSTDEALSIRKGKINGHETLFEKGCAERIEHTAEKAKSDGDGAFLSYSAQALPRLEL
jgi:uncharacterized protein (DUF1015 family)